MKPITPLSFEDILKAAANAPPQTEAQKKASAAILKKLGASGPMKIMIPRRKK